MANQQIMPVYRVSGEEIIALEIPGDDEGCVMDGETHGHFANLVTSIVNHGIRMARGIDRDNDDEWDRPQPWSMDNWGESDSEQSRQVTPNQPQDWSDNWEEYGGENGTEDESPSEVLETEGLFEQVSGTQVESLNTISGDEQHQLADESEDSGSTVYSFSDNENFETIAPAEDVPDYSDAFRLLFDDVVRFRRFGMLPSEIQSQIWTITIESAIFESIWITTDERFEHLADHPSQLDAGVFALRPGRRRHDYSFFHDHQEDDHGARYRATPHFRICRESRRAARRYFGMSADEDHRPVPSFFLFSPDHDRVWLRYGLPLLDQKGLFPARLSSPGFLDDSVSRDMGVQLFHCKDIDREQDRGAFVTWAVAPRQLRRARNLEVHWVWGAVSRNMNRYREALTGDDDDDDDDDDQPYRTGLGWYFELFPELRYLYVWILNRGLVLPARQRTFPPPSLWKNPYLGNGAALDDDDRGRNNNSTVLSMNGEAMRHPELHSSHLQGFDQWHPENGPKIFAFFLERLFRAAQRRAARDRNFAIEFGMQDVAAKHEDQIEVTWYPSWRWAFQ